jgi:acyl carrier protein
VDHVAQAVKDYIVAELLHDKPPQHLENDESLIRSQILDSLDIFTLVAFLEKQFGVKIQDADLEDGAMVENFETVNAIQRLVEARLLSKPRTKS